jgi:methionyl-tRNA formyltransferase
VVVLTGSGIMHRHTCATLLRAGVNVVGIVECRREGLAARVRHLNRWRQRYGLLRTVDQIVARTLYRVLRNSRDDAALARLVDAAADRQIIAASGVPVLVTDSYSRSDTFDAIRTLDPDLMVVHSPFIVGAKVRALTPGRVIGGHPGITPDFRGSYSAFWAMALARPDKVGWTVFLLDDGIDTGPILAQESLTLEPGDTHMTLSWKGMACEAAAQARLIKALDDGHPAPLRHVTDVPEDSYFSLPTTSAMYRYLKVEPRLSSRLK